MANKKVLIVEDDQVIAYVHAYYAEQCGLEVTDCVESGEKALESIARNTPDAVLMDIRIEGEISGIDTAKKIREQLDIPIIFISGNSDARTQSEIIDDGKTYFLVKPIRPDDLHALLGKI